MIFTTFLETKEIDNELKKDSRILPRKCKGGDLKKNKVKWQTPKHTRSNTLQGEGTRGRSVRDPNNSGAQQEADSKFLSIDVR